MRKYPIKLIVLMVICILLLSTWFFSDQKKIVIASERRDYGSFLQNPMNAGLPLSLRRLDKQNDALYLIVHKPKHTIEYSSPKKLGQSLFMNIDESLNAGHVQLAWSCVIDNQRFESALGFTGDKQGQSLSLLKSDFGASTLFAIFKDGTIEEPWIVESDIRRSNERGLLKIFKIDPKLKCKEILFSLFKFINSKELHQFSIAVNPQGNGGKAITHNCSSLILESLLPLGAIGQYLKQSSMKKLMIPVEYLGNNSSVKLPPKTELPEFIKLLKREVPMNIALPTKWNGQGVEAVFYDPGELSKLTPQEGLIEISFDTRTNK